jgi:hypothetical protein
MGRGFRKLNESNPALKAEALHFTQEFRMPKRLIKQTEPLLLGVTVPRRVVTQFRYFSDKRVVQPKLEVEQPTFLVDKFLNFSNVKLH